MIYLITGIPRHGKTLRAVWMLEKFVNEGREVFARIDGLKLEGAQPAPDNWTEVPDQAVVCYDEAQQIFPPDGAGRSSREDLQAMELHGHRGIDIVLITQHPNLLHSHVRRLVGRHEHVKRIFGSNNAKIYRKDEVMKIDSLRQLETADSEVWAYPKRLFKLYRSATHHSEVYRFKVPNRIRWMVAAMVLMAIGAVYTLMGTDHNMLKTAIAKEEGTSIATQPANYPSIRPPAAVQLMGCISSARACQCYDTDGQVLEMDDMTCRLTIERPMPRPLTFSAS